MVTSNKNNKESHWKAYKVKETENSLSLEIKKDNEIK